MENIILKGERDKSDWQFGWYKKKKKGNRKSESSLNQFPLTEFSFHNAFQVRRSVRIDLKRWTVTWNIRVVSFQLRSPPPVQLSDRFI